MALRDPRFNLREIVKHLLLVEDHLMHQSRNCEECLTKHLLTVEALSEEAQTLDTTGEYSDLLDTVTEFSRGVQDSLLKKDATPQELGQLVREARKTLCKVITAKGGELLADTSCDKSLVEKVAKRHLAAERLAVGETASLQVAVSNGNLLRATDDLSVDFGSWDVFWNEKAGQVPMEVLLVTGVPLETATALIDFNTAAGSSFTDGASAWDAARGYVTETLFTFGG